MTAPVHSWFAEDDLVPLSALQHLLFCERQCALIHLERLWAENPLTVEGRDLHERVDGAAGEARRDVRIARGVPLHSFRLGLAGKADVVEFHRLLGDSTGGVTLPRARGRWRPFPVEYKRGRPKRDLSDKVQLCAQALCLEEMLDAAVPAGALFYGRTRRRLDVAFDDDLRRWTETACARLHALLGSGVTPPARREPKCESCSLLELCRPEALDLSASGYLRKVLAVR